MELVISSSGKASKPFLDRIRLLKEDIVDQDVDAIAIAIPQNLDFKGSINEAIMAASGHNLDEFILDNIYRPKVGEVYAIPAFNLPAKNILIGVIPNYRTEFDLSDSHLSGVVRRIMELSRCMLLSSIAFPPIASGRGAFPKAKAARLISQGISDRMEESFEDVRIVCQDHEMIEHFDRSLRNLGWEG